ncbi:MAG TPA: zf-TFIIB domain-containing protein [Myxococcales bacterium]|jgi:hypothetical protein
MPGKPHHSEDEYFVREEALKKQKLALAEAKKLVVEQREELKKTHWMHCPKCGMTLHTLEFKGVEIDRCFNCKGTWLDEGELEKIAAHDNARKGAWVKSVLGIFEPTKGTTAKKK